MSTNICINNLSHNDLTEARNYCINRERSKLASRKRSFDCKMIIKKRFIKTYFIAHLFPFALSHGLAWVWIKKLLIITSFTNWLYYVYGHASKQNLPHIHISLFCFQTCHTNRLFIIKTKRIKYFFYYYYLFMHF